LEAEVFWFWIGVVLMSVVVTPSGTRGVSYPIPRRLMALLARIPLALQRLSGGRLKMHGQPLLLLTTVGTRTGQPRTSMVAQFPESDGSTLIVASFWRRRQTPGVVFQSG
jgi:F420H(2)-dependent quinone reductase